MRMSIISGTGFYIVIYPSLKIMFISKDWLNVIPNRANILQNFLHNSAKYADSLKDIQILHRIFRLIQI